MNDKFTLAASVRDDIGKGASRRLRHADLVPAIIYGANKSPSTINIDHKSIMRALENEAFYSHILTINFDSQEEKVVLKDVQRHPYKPRIMHVDFMRISATEKLTMHIPLHFMGGDACPGVKVSGGLISHLMTEVAIRCLPADLPEYINVDLSKLEINQAVHLSELPVTKGVEIVDLIHGEDRPVATVYIPRAIVEEVPVAAAAAPTEEEAKAAAAAGEAGKETGKEAGKEAAGAATKK